MKPAGAPDGIILDGRYDNQTQKKNKSLSGSRSISARVVV